MIAARRAVLAALAAVGSIALTACGSAPLSPGALRHRATAICVPASRRLDSIAAPQTAQGARPFLEEGVSALSREVGLLRGLSASGEAGHVYADAVRAVGGELTAIQATIHSLSRGTAAVPALRALSQRLTPLEAQANEAWRALQIPACVSH